MTTSISTDRPIAGGPPGFTVTSDRAHCEVQVASDPVLFNEALRDRRKDPKVWAASGPLLLEEGRVRWTLDSQAWSQMGKLPYLYYRAYAFGEKGGKRVLTEATVADLNPERAPFLYIPAAGLKAPPLPRWISGKLPGLRVRGNQLVNEPGDVVVLRGINRSGMEYSDAVRQPDGVTVRTSKQVAGITQANIVEMVHAWGANVIRLPVNQEWALTRENYAADIDQIIDWAAQEGAYTIIDLQWFDDHRVFGGSKVPPLPEENSNRFWYALASRYAGQTAVLFDILSEPHRPPDDRSFLAPPAKTDADWIAQWHAWAQRLATTIQTADPKRVVLVSGWDWASDLRSFPVKVGGGQPLENAIYSAHVYHQKAADTTFATVAKIETRLGGSGPTGLRTHHPVFLAEWGGDTKRDRDPSEPAEPLPPNWDQTILNWGAELERFLRTNHRFANGGWQGIAGWTAWAWGDWPVLAQRAGGNTGSYIVSHGHNPPTDFGELVRGALLTMPFAPSAEFDPGLPSGTRFRYTINAGPAIQGDLFFIRGHDFKPGTKVTFRPAVGAAVELVPNVVLPQLLMVLALPAAIPLGSATVEVAVPDRPLSRDAVNVVARRSSPLIEILPGAAKAAPFTIGLFGNPQLERADGSIVVDPIQTDQSMFASVVMASLASFFGLDEAALHAYAHEIRVVAQLAPTAPPAWSRAVCKERGIQIQIDRVAAADYLAALNLKTDLALFVSASAPKQSIAESSLDDLASDDRIRGYEGKKLHQRRGTKLPGVAALHVPMDHVVDPLHELVHTMGEDDNGEIDDLYNDTKQSPFAVNKKFRSGPHKAVPLLFATYDNESYASDPRRDGLGYEKSWSSYHPELIQKLFPNLMDSYRLDPKWLGSRLDRLTLRFIRDRIEWKLGR